MKAGAKIRKKVEPEPKISSFGSATLNRTNKEQTQKLLRKICKFEAKPGKMDTNRGTE